MKKLPKPLDGYAVTKNGMIWAFPNAAHNGMWMKQKDTRNGYKRIGLRVNGKQKYFFIHRLVLIAFSGPPEKGWECNHKNGIKSDNRLCNLQWCTKSENLSHAWTNGLVKITKNRQAASRKNIVLGHIANRSLAHQAAMDLKKEYLAGGVMQKELAAKYGVTQQIVSNIVRGKNYSEKK